MTPRMLTSHLRMIWGQREDNPKESANRKGSNQGQRPRLQLAKRTVPHLVTTREYPQVVTRLT